MFVDKKIGKGPEAYPDSMTNLSTNQLKHVAVPVSSASPPAFLPGQSAQSNNHDCEPDSIVVL